MVSFLEVRAILMSLHVHDVCRSQPIELPSLIQFVKVWVAHGNFSVALVGASVLGSHSAPLSLSRIDGFGVYIKFVLDDHFNRYFLILILRLQRPGKLLEQLLAKFPSLFGLQLLTDRLFFLVHLVDDVCEAELVLCFLEQLLLFLRIKFQSEILSQLLLLSLLCVLDLLGFFVVVRLGHDCTGGSRLLAVVISFISRVVLPFQVLSL